ncbi:MAG TPA: methylmalonyl Co-A mutase-associated GTPase MeaB [Terriglobia bacterium]|nr:methylmalonyl Co-A mutase-associated GTPase MeaB [Terriglobia bacterium]
MPEVDHAFVERILAGDRRAIARAISSVENRDPTAVPLLRELFPKAGRARVVGLTGSPGAGKSTLVEKLAADYRRRGERVGILAVDPTSPFSGGAILGDRVRMQSLANDPGVYIRSMATRGQLGGLAPTTQDAVTILDAAGCEVVLIETVGVGQDEVEVARLADATVLLLVPGLGDDIQTFKAGVMEIADLYVINKADRPGADRVEQEVTAMLSLAIRPDGWRPPIVKTVATTGQGISELVQALDQFHGFSQRGDVTTRRRKEHWRSRLLDLLRQTLFERAVAAPLLDGSLDRQVADLLSHQKDPHQIVEEIIAALLPGSADSSNAFFSSSAGVKIHHLGIAVESLARAVPIFQELTGKAPEAEECVADQKVRMAAFRLGDSRLELLESTEADSPIARFIAKRGQGIHHVAFAVPDLPEALRKLESDGVRLIDRQPRVGAGNAPIAFVHPASTAGVLIELIEES